MHLLRPALSFMCAQADGPSELAWEPERHVPRWSTVCLVILGQPTSTGPPGCLAVLEIGYVPNVAGNNKASVQPLCAGLISGKCFNQRRKESVVGAHLPHAFAV